LPLVSQPGPGCLTSIARDQGGRAGPVVRSVGGRRRPAICGGQKASVCARRSGSRQPTGEVEAWHGWHW
jgi:hypothetical protein